MNPVHELVDNLMRAYPPDGRSSISRAAFEDPLLDCARQKYYSGSCLEKMVGSEIARKICQANEGERLWERSVRNYLIAWAEHGK